jgi:hypothetical protein
MTSSSIDETNTIGVLLEIFERIQRAKDSVKGKAPYHFNALLNAEPLEPAVSKILAGFFMQKTNGDYRILKDFVYTNWGGSLSSLIDNPTFSTEEVVKGDKRIDILIYEKEKYAIVMENKIWDAEDQPNQLANYIEAMLGVPYNFNEEQIYVAYLPKTKEHVPSPISWKRQGDGGSYKEEFQDRYRLIDFKEKILPWLESSKEIKKIKENPYFENSRFLFIDFLRRKLDIDNIDNMAQKEIEKQLREYFSNSESAIADANKLVYLINKLPKIDVNEVVKHLAKIRKEKTKMAMQEWLSYLERDYKDTFFDSSTKAHMAVGTTVRYKDYPAFFNVFIWNYQYNEANSVAISLTDECSQYRKEIEPKVRDLVRGKKGFTKGYGWLCYKFVSFEEAYPLLQELVRELPYI